MSKKDIYVLGIDIGSTASKCALLKNGKDIVSYNVFNFGTGTSGPAKVMSKLYEDTGFTREDIDCIVATGYGRNTLEEADKEVSELSAHAKGVNFFFPEARTVIDIGGQDVKILHISDKGTLENFVMNDKCAAGTGRFLEVMARILEADVNDLEEMDYKATSEVSISSTCTVFAESEVISQLATGANRNDIVRGIHKSVSQKVSGFARRLGIKEQVVMSGGVAKNGAVRKALSEELGVNIETTDMCQYFGAIGAAIIGFNSLEK